MHDPSAVSSVAKYFSEVNKHGDDPDALYESTVRPHIEEILNQPPPGCSPDKPIRVREHCRARPGEGKK